MGDPTEDIDEIRNIKGGLQSTSERIDKLMEDHLTSLLAGQCSDLDAQRFAGIVRCIAIWLSGREANSTHIEGLTLLLLLTQWGIDLERICSHVQLDDDEIKQMLLSLVSNGLIGDDGLVHAWCDSAGSHLRQQLLVYLGIMLGVITFE